MKLGKNAKITVAFCISGFLLILIGLILMHNGHIIWSYKAIGMGMVFLLLGIDANRKILTSLLCQNLK